MSRGWGGARVGSGPKPKPKPPKSGGLSIVPPATKAEDHSLLMPPSELPKEQQKVWSRWAPLALKRGTLIPENVPAFELLCEMAVRRAALGVLVDSAQPTPEALRLLAQYSKQVEGLMGRFRLAPFGKPEAPDKPKTAASPWGAFASTKKA